MIRPKTLRVCGAPVGGHIYCRLPHGHEGPHEDRGTKWYVIGTVRAGESLYVTSTPLAIMGTWTRQEADEKCASLREKFPNQEFDVVSEEWVSKFRKTGTSCP